MSIRRLADGRYQLRYFASGTKASARRQETLPEGTTWAEADAIHKDRLASAARRRGSSADETLTFETLAHEYLETQGANMAPASLLRCKGVLENHALPRFGSQRVAKLKPGHIERYRQERIREGANPGTVNREWIIIQAVLNWGETMELIDRNPIRRKAIKKLKTAEQRTIYFDRAEWSRFIAAFEDPGRWRKHLAGTRRLGPVKDGRRHGGGRNPESEASVALLGRLRETVPVFEALLFTASRLSEVLALRWRDVDLKGGVVRIWQGKTRRPKVLPLSPRLREILEARPRGVGDAPVFTRADGSPFYKVEIQRAFGIAKKVAGLRSELTVHSIRHTAASWMAIAGQDLLRIKEALGHTNIATTLRYSHLRAEHLVEALGVLEEVSARADRTIAAGVNQANPEGLGDARVTREGVNEGGESSQVIEGEWRPQRDSNPCCRRERAVS